MSRPPTIKWSEELQSSNQIIGLINGSTRIVYSSWAAAELLHMQGMIKFNIEPMINGFKHFFIGHFFVENRCT